MSGTIFRWDGNVSERMNSEQFKKAQRKASKSKLEDRLTVALSKAAMLQDCCGQYQFHRSRKWKADFAWPRSKVLVEVEGGTWTRGRHTRPRGFQADCEKYNAAAELGWIVLRYTSDDITHRLPSVVAQIRRVLER